MNDYTKQLEETNAKQASIIETLRKTNDELVEKYNELVDKYNEAADMLNACGVKGDSKSGWTTTMDLDRNVGDGSIWKVGNVNDPKGDLLAKGIDIDKKQYGVILEGDSIV